MRYGILGPLEVTDDVRTVPLAQGRQRLLLAVLLLHANEAVSVDRLIDALWGESPPPTAGRSLHNLVSSLRKRLGGDVLVTEGHGYRLRIADGELDSEQFARLVAQGREAMAGGDAARAASVLRQALALWRGPALGDLAYEPAVSDEAVRLEELRVGVLEDRLDADLALGLHGEVTPELERLVAEHPLRERIAGQHMLALYRAGRQADALRVYAETRRRMVDELGIEPGPALRRLEQAVLDQSPDLGVPDALPPPPAAPARRAIRPPVIAGVGAALVAATVGAVLLFGGSGSHATALGSLSGNTLAAIDARTNRIVAAVRVGGTPTSVAVGDGAVWVLNADDRTIARVDPETGHARTLGVGATPTDLAAGPGELWVGVNGEFGTDRVMRLDATPTVRARIALRPSNHQGAPGGPGQMALGGGALWVINDGEDLERVDARTGRVTAVVRPLRARAVTSDRVSIWALASDDTSVVQIDPRNGKVRRRFHIQAAQLDAIAAGDGAVWAADSYEGTLWRIDTVPKVVARTIAVGVGADSVAAAEGSVWVANSLRGTVTRVDPRTNRVVRTIGVGNTPRDVDVGDGRVWVSLAGREQPVPAARAGATGIEALPGPACRGILSSGARPPDVLIASDFPLQADPAFDTLPIANAVAFTVRQHGFRAGRFRVGYQSCDDSTGNSAQADDKKCRANAKAYAADSAVVGVVGPEQSGCARVEIPILNRAPGGPVALISPSNSIIGLTHADPLAPRGALERMYPKRQRNYARVFPADDAEAAADAELARQLGLRGVYVLSDGGPVGAELALLFRRSARALGLGLAGSARWDPGGAGFARLAARVRRARADGVFLAGLAGSNGGPLVRALRASRGRSLTLIGANPFGPVDFVYEQSHGAARGIYLSDPGPIIERLGARGRRFMREYAPTQHGATIREVAVYAAAATEVLLDAIGRSDGTRASVSRQLLATHLADSAIGPIDFDANGDLTHPVVTIMRVRARDGVSAVPTYEGAAFDRVITPPARAIR